MAQYTDKSNLVAEIDRRIKVLQKNPYENHKTICHLDSLKQSLDIFEVKEIDLEKEIDLVEDKYHGFESLSRADVIEIIKYFFELGLKENRYKT